MKLILVRGCFDVPHIGHVLHLEQARAMGDILLVSVTPDEYVNKGHGRPVFTTAQRVAVLNSLKCVTLAFAASAPTAVPEILLLKPALFVKGPDARTDTSNGLRAEIEAVRRHGGDIAYTDCEIFSSTEIHKHYMEDLG